MPVRIIPVLAALAVAGLPLLAEARAPSSVRYETAQTSYGNYLAAVVAGRARDIDAEAQFLREALAMDPSNTEMQRSALFAFLANGDFKDAFVIAQRILRANASEPEIALLARTTLVVEAMHERRFRDAVRLIDETEKAAANDPSLAILKAWAKLGSGRPKEAFAAIVPLEKGATAPLADYMKGLMAGMIRDLKTATLHLQRAYEKNRQELRVADAFARLLAVRGDKGAALKIYEDIDKRIPGQVLIADPLAQLRAGKTPTLLITASSEGAAELFFILSDIGDPSPGGKLRENIYLQFASYLAPKNPIFAAALAQSFENSGQTQRAIDVYETVPVASSLRASSDIRRVRSLQRMEKSEEALKLLESLLKAKPTDIDLLRTAALLHRAEKRWTDAITYYDRAIAALGTVTADNWDLLYGRGISYERAKNWPPAERDFKATLEILPQAKPGQPFARERAQVLNYLAYTWVDRHENIDEAFRMLKDAVALTDGRDGYIVDSLGWAHYRLGQYETAVTELEKAVELKPGDPVINDHLGDAYWKVGRKLEAGFKWNHAKSLNPEPDDLKKINDKIENGLKDPPTAAQGGKTGNGG